MEVQVQELCNFVGGRYVESAEERRSEVVDPTTGQAYTTAPVSGPADVDAAMKAADAPFEGWRDATPSERQRALLRIVDTIDDRAEKLSTVESRNTGKPLAVSGVEEIPPVVDQLRFFAGAARLLEGRSAGEYLVGRTSFIRPEPIGFD